MAEDTTRRSDEREMAKVIIDMKRRIIQLERRVIDLQNQIDAL